MPDIAHWWARLTATQAPGAVILIRLYAGAVFLSEGIQKFLYPDRLGTGRFDLAGIPAPGFFAPLDGVLEIACGLLLLAGLLTRVAAAVMVVNMIGALAITKLPILWGDAPLFADASGWWDFAHASRTDVAQLCGGLFLLTVGAGPHSLDARLARHAGLEAATRP
ncbi:DoxX family protein [Streptomyces apocyni]|uniref:DoxX family protein n=1 Tax=Streptomyces apocyni TaxID=2654677 RepID=UPI0012E9A3EE|nr:DoxX family protein [Streptomyces apocyni]